MPRPLFKSRSQATDAIVVRLSDYAETSAVVLLLTASMGLVRALAKGARRLSNSFRGPLDKALLYRVRLSRRGREGLFLLHSAEAHETFPRLRREAARFHAAELALEVAADLMREGESHEELFRLTAFTLKVLDRAPPPRLGRVATLFLARAVALSGHAPEIDHCVGCGRALAGSQALRISSLRGGVLHARCGQEEPGARPVRRATLETLRLFRARPAAELLAGDLAEEPCRQVRLLLEEWLQQALERRFRAAAPMEREIARSVG